MSNTKTEAQRLADAMDSRNPWDKPLDRGTVNSAAAELRRLDTENQQLKTSLALVQQHHATAWNRGHRAGLRAAESTIKQATDAVNADAWGNTQLTNALMQAEAERDQLRAQLDQAVAEEREACAKVCDRIDLEYEGEDVQATWCAAAIRARSNT